MLAETAAAGLLPVTEMSALRLIPGRAGSLAEGTAACLPAEVSQLVARVGTVKRRVRQGDTLFHTGASFHNLFVVRTGMFKTVLFDSEGRDQVTGFHMAGDVLGLEGIERETHQSSAIALEDS